MPPKAGTGQATGDYWQQAELHSEMMQAKTMMILINGYNHTVQLIQL